MNNSNELLNESVGKLLFKFSVPAIIGMIVNSFYNIIDRMFIGRGVGTLAIAGLSVTFPILIITWAFAMLVGVGAAALISIRLGENRKEEAEKILGNAFSLTIIVSILVTIICFLFMNKILMSFGASENTIMYAREYLNIILLGVVFQNIGFGLNNIIRAEGNPKVAMKTMLIGAILNVILDPIFIFAFNLGIRGAAIATVISQFVSMIWVTSYFVGKNSVLKFKRNNFKIDFNLMMEIFAIGMSPFAMQIASSFVNVLFNKQLIVYGGDLAVGAMGIINSLVMLILMPIFGINQGVQPIIGFNYGAKQYDRVKKAYKLAVIAGITIATMGFILVNSIPSVLIGMFNRDEMLMDVAVNGMKIFLIMLPIVGFQIVSANFFEAIGKAKKSMILSLSRQVLILIPILLISPTVFGLNGVWASAPTSDLLSSILTAIFILIEMKKLRDDHEVNIESKIA